MGVIDLNHKIKFSLEPIFSKKCVFISFKSTEKYLGAIPDITLEVACNEDLVKPLDKITGKVTSADGFSVNFQAYVYASSYANNRNIIRMLVCDEKFARNVVTTKYKSIDEALPACYPMDIVKNCTSAIKGLNLFQENESNHAYLTRLLWGYKKDTIFGYSLGSVRLHDLNSYKHVYDFGNAENISPIQDTQWGNPKLFTDKVEIVEEFSRHYVIKFNSSIIYVSKNYKELLSNYIYNQKFIYSTKGEFEFTVDYLPPVMLTDGVRMVNKDAQMKEYYVNSRTLEFTYNYTKNTFGVSSLKPI